MPTDLIMMKPAQELLRDQMAAEASGQDAFSVPQMRTATAIPHPTQQADFIQAAFGRFAPQLLSPKG